MFVRRMHVERKTTWKAKKTKLDIVHCTSMIKALQQPQLAAGFVKYIEKIPWTIALAIVALRNFGTKIGYAKIIPILNAPL